MPKLIPSFPPCEGPYKVGTVDIEVPVSGLLDGLGEDEGVRIKFEQQERTVHTILFRVFYPATGEHPGTNNEHGNGKHEGKGGWGHYLHGFMRGGKEKPVYWVPEPYQEEYLKGYLRFGGLSREWLVNWLGGRASLLSHYFNNITIPAIADSPLKDAPSTTSRFPTMIFSHGLGGSRLAYSHFCTNMASHGVVVFAPEHRDGSGPVSVIRRRKANGEKEFSTESVPYVSIPHQLTEEMSEARDYQLSTRFTEISLLYKAIQSLDTGIIPKGTIYHGEEVVGEDTQLRMFKNKLDVKTPGRVIWAGHSFGAATIVQFLKSVYYMGTEEWKAQVPLFTLHEEEAAELQKQITKESPLLLLDLWSLSLLGSKRTYWLWKKPLPQVLPLDEGEKSGVETDCRILAIMTQQFFIWKENMWAVKWLLSRNPALRDGAVREIFEYDPITGKKIDSPPSSSVSSGSATPTSVEELAKDGEKDGYRSPKLYYARDSAHLTQSDFGILFPILFRKAVADPKKVFDFNIRAAVQWLREAGYRKELAPYNQIGETDDLEILTNAEVEEGFEGEQKSQGVGEKDKPVLQGWVKLGLHEEKIKKRDVKKAVREGMGAGGEADLEAEEDLEEGRERGGKGKL